VLEQDLTPPIDFTRQRLDAQVQAPPVHGRIITILAYTEFVKQYIPESALPRLDGWKDRTLEEDRTDLRSQLFFEDDRATIRGNWGEFLYRHDMSPSLRQFEETEERRIGPYSPRWKWEDRLFSIGEYTAPRNFQPQPRIYAKCLEKIRRLVPPKSVPTLTIDESIERLPKSTNSGLPWFTRDTEALNDYKRRAKAAIDGEEVEVLPAVAGWRGTPRGEGLWPAQRLIQMVDKLDTILGGRWLPGILDALRRHPRFSAYIGLDAVDSVMRVMLLRSKGRNLYSSDFDGFDASAEAQVLYDLLDIIRGWLSDDRGFDVMQRNFVAGNLLTPTGVVELGEGGVRSGTDFTSLVGTLYNALSALYAGEVIGSPLQGGVFLGDDAVTDYGRDVPQTELSDAVADLNLTMNAEKQYISQTSAHYLQNLYQEEDLDQSGGSEVHGIRPTMRALNGMISYERRRNADEWSHAMAAMRTIMQLEPCRWNMSFGDFVRFARSGDELLQQVDPVIIAKMAGGLENVDKVLGYTAYRGVNRQVSSLESFESVKILRKLLA
jgi:hypothetical protein